MSNFVLVVDTNRKPLNPCTPGVARSLLKSGKAKVFRRFPFTIVLNKVVDTNPEPMQLKIDPGSKVTGLALLQGDRVVWGGEITHRGQQIKDCLESRSSLKRGRRNRKTRYRQARFLNRTRPQGWLAPSLQHRVETTLTWINRLRRYAPITGISQELVRFDLQQMENPEISGAEYQQGTLFNRLKQTGLPVETGSGGKTKYNRCRLEHPLHHYIDAACVGNVDNLQVLTTQPLLIKATGHGTRQMCRIDKHGFPSRYVPRNKFVKGFQTGDIVKAIVASGKKIGTYVGRVAVRSTGSFNISTANGLIQGISHKYCIRVHAKDGYGYNF